MIFWGDSDRRPLHFYSPIKILGTVNILITAVQRVAQIIEIHPPIRMAIGATRRAVAGVFVREGVTVFAIGVGCGLVGERRSGIRLSA